MNLYESSEDYLERILMLKNKNGQVHAIDIAKDMGFSKPSVSRAINNLKDNLYIKVDKSGLIELTKKGMKVASLTYEKHETLAKYFIGLGVSEKQAYIDACKVEHDISLETFEKIKEHMNK